jgi:pseudaminic acid biosynthesis-associated methylase
MNKQEKFWKEEYVQEYIDRNSSFDRESGQAAWRKMLEGVAPISSFLELGPNIGRNIESLSAIYPNSRKSIVEIGTKPFEIITSRFDFEIAQNNSFFEASLPFNYFDLVFTCGVLIHVAPENLLETMRVMHESSKRYILMCEMFSRTPKTVTYRGSNEQLFTRDFGRFFVENFDVRIVNYGFLWGYFFDSAGFDDANYWVFEKVLE